MLPVNNHISKGLETIVWKYINLIRHIIVTRWKHTKGHNWWPYLSWSSLGKWCAAWLGVHRCVAQRPILLMKIHSKSINLHAADRLKMVRRGVYHRSRHTPTSRTPRRPIDIQTLVFPSHLLYSWFMAMKVASVANGQQSLSWSLTLGSGGGGGCKIHCSYNRADPGHPYNRPSWLHKERTEVVEYSFTH